MKIEWTRIIPGRVKADADLVLAQPFASELALDILPKNPPRPRKLPRHCGFVLAKHAARFSQCQLLLIVTAEPKAVARAQSRDRNREDAAQPRKMIVQHSRLSSHCTEYGNGRLFSDLVGERFEPALHADAIDVALREHRAQPRGEAAPPVEIVKQRAPFAVAFLQTVQVGIQRVGELAGAAAWIERIGRSIQHGPVFEDKSFPGRLVTGRALPRKREIFDVKRAHGQVYSSQLFTAAAISPSSELKP